MWGADEGGQVPGRQVGGQVWGAGESVTGAKGGRWGNRWRDRCGVGWRSGEEGHSEWGPEALRSPPLECPAGTFGQNCSGSCSCGGAPCDRVTGQCLCPPGRTGDDCGAGEWQPWPRVTSAPSATQCLAAFADPNPGALQTPGPSTAATRAHTTSLGSGCGHLWLPRGRACRGDTGNCQPRGQLGQQPPALPSLWWVL